MRWCKLFDMCYHPCHFSCLCCACSSTHINMLFPTDLMFCQVTIYDKVFFFFFQSHDFQENYRAINPPQFYSGKSNIQMQVILLALTCLLICQGATKKQSWFEVMPPKWQILNAIFILSLCMLLHWILLPTLCTYLIKNYHNSHLKPHTLKMSVMHN